MEDRKRHHLIHRSLPSSFRLRSLCDKAPMCLSTGMNSVRNSVSSEPHFRPTPPTPFAFITAEGIFVPARCESRHRHANRATQTAKRDNWDIPASHTGLIGLSAPPRPQPPGRGANSAPSKPENHCNINFLSRGGGSSPERTRLRVKFPVMQGKYREFSRIRPILPLFESATLLKNRHFFLKFPTRWNREFS
jgi:hypothetical protein